MAAAAALLSPPWLAGAHVRLGDYAVSALIQARQLAPEQTNALRPQLIPQELVHAVQYGQRFLNVCKNDQALYSLRHLFGLRLTLGEPACAFQRE